MQLMRMQSLGSLVSTYAFTSSITSTMQGREGKKEKNQFSSAIYTHQKWETKSVQFIQGHPTVHFSEYLSEGRVNCGHFTKPIITRTTV